MESLVESIKDLRLREALVQVPQRTWDIVRTILGIFLAVMIERSLIARGLFQYDAAAATASWVVSGAFIGFLLGVLIANDRGFQQVGSRISVAVVSLLTLVTFNSLGAFTVPVEVQQAMPYVYTFLSGIFSCTLSILTVQLVVLLSGGGSIEAEER
jgi:hypothetical protein